MARAIDLGLLTLVALIAFGTAGLLTGLFFGGLKQEDLTRREWTGGLIATLIASAVWVGCFAWSEFIGIGRRGQTVGQRMYGVTIVTAEDEPPGVLRAILRSGSWIVPLFLGAVAWPGVSDSANPFAMLVIVVASLSIPGWALFDRKGRGLHDHLTGTRAVVNR